MATKLVVIADPHVALAPLGAFAIDSAGRFAAAVEHVHRHHPDAERIVLLGDLVHGGDPDAYHRVREVVERATIPVSMVLGNHDARPAFRACLPSQPVDAHGFVQHTARSACGLLVFLDTLHPSAGLGGRLCARRLEWLDRQLAGEAGPAFLFLHHPPGITGFPGMDAIRLTDEQALFEVLARHANVRFIFAGHVHRAVSGAWDGIPFAVVTSIVYQQPMDLSTADPSLASDEPPRYGVVLVDGATVAVHAQDLAPPGRVTADASTLR
jgi:3',5'-cyclic AMP phosphodiesterase CpdA